VDRGPWTEDWGWRTGNRDQYSVAALDTSATFGTIGSFGTFGTLRSSATFGTFPHTSKVGALVGVVRGVAVGGGGVAVGTRPIDQLPDGGPATARGLSAFLLDAALELAGAANEYRASPARGLMANACS